MESRLTWIKDLAERAKSREIIGLYSCTCGGTIELPNSRVRNKVTLSCGCIHKEWLLANNPSHRMSKTKTYNSWAALKQRCEYLKSKNYSRYGGRGIKVCPRWSKFENFHEDMGTRPDGMTLDRVDNDGDYSKENCRWADTKTQSRNKSNTIMLTAYGISMIAADWAEALEIPAMRIIARSRSYGYSDHDALFKPKMDINGVFV